MTLAERPAEIASGPLRLEARVHDARRDLAAIVLHPHPQYGGDMDNHVVVAVCEAFAAASAATVRFNFRGTGRSQGAYGGGIEEAGDARAAMKAARGWWPGANIALVGYSFGAAVAASVAGEDVRALVLISPPASLMPDSNLPEELPGLILTGESDALAPAARLARWASAVRPLVVAPGVGHAWWPGVDFLSMQVADFALRMAGSGLRNP